MKDGIKKSILTILLITFLCPENLVYANKTHIHSKQEADSILRIGVGDRYPIFCYEFSNEIKKMKGFDYELAKLISRSLGLTPRFTLIKKLEDRELLLKENKLDIVIYTYSKTEERSKTVQFSKTPYYKDTDPLVFVQNSGNSLIDLETDSSRNLSLGVLLNSNSEYFIRNDTRLNRDDFFEVFYLPTYEQMYNKLYNNELDLILDDGISGKLTEQIGRARIVNQAPYDVNDEFYIGMRKGNEILNSKIDELLITLKKNEVLDSLFNNQKQEFIKYIESTQRKEKNLTSFTYISISIIVLIVYIYLIRRKIKSRRVIREINETQEVKKINIDFLK